MSADDLKTQRATSRHSLKQIYMRQYKMFSFVVTSKSTSHPQTSFICTWNVNGTGRICSAYILLHCMRLSRLSVHHRLQILLTSKRFTVVSWWVYHRRLYSTSDGFEKNVFLISIWRLFVVGGYCIWLLLLLSLWKDILCKSFTLEYHRDRS